MVTSSQVLGRGGYLYALCWWQQSFNEALGIAGSQIPNIHMSSLEPWGDREHSPGRVPPDMCGTFQKAWQLTWQVQVGLSGHS